VVGKFPADASIDFHDPVTNRPTRATVRRARTYGPTADGRRNAAGGDTYASTAEALSQITREHTARYGWNKSMTERTQRGIRILLGTQDTPGAPVRASDVIVLAAIGIGAPTVLGVLSEAGMLDDDRTPTVEAWFNRRIADLPARMREELRIWFDVMRHGSITYPRRKPRATSTIYTQLDFALPALRVWGQRHESLREISREDFLAILPASGTPRATLIGGVRSIFRVLKPRKVVFTDPTYRVGGAVHDKPLPPPVDVATLKPVDRQ
jgi:hypothetical protein